MGQPTACCRACPAIRGDRDARSITLFAAAVWARRQGEAELAPHDTFADLIRALAYPKFRLAVSAQVGHRIVTARDFIARLPAR
jgi:hypothetical protein